MLSAHQRKPVALSKGIRILFANEQSHFKDLSQSSLSPKQINDMDCRTLNFRPEKGRALSLARLTLQETEQVHSSEVILHPYTVTFI